MTGSTENWLKIAIAALTGIAAALGVQMSPAARPEDVGAVVRAEIAPLAAKVDKMSAQQEAQGARLAVVESIVLPKDATP